MLNNGDKSVFRKSPAILFLDHFVAVRLGRKQEVSVVVVGIGGEQKNWSRLKGKWAWWALPPISQISTDHKQIHQLLLLPYSGEISQRI